VATRYDTGGSGPKLAILALLAVFLGLVYVFWGKIKERMGDEFATSPGPAQEAEYRPTPKPTPRPAEKAPDVRRPPETTTVQRKPQRPSAGDVTRAKDLHKRGELALREFRFDEAAELFGKEASVIALDSDAAARATTFQSKAETFGKMLKSVERNPEASEKNVILRCHDGRNMEVALIGETDSHYIVARRGNIRGEVDKNEVKEIVPVPREAQRLKALQAFEGEEAKQVDHSGIAHFLLAKKAYQDGLDDKALDHLEVAFKKDGADLPESLERHNAGQMLLTAMWCDSTGRSSLAKMWCRRLKREYPGQKGLVADADELLNRMDVVVANYAPTVTIKYREEKSTAPKAKADSGSPPEEKVTGVEVAAVKSGNARNRDYVKQINSLFEEGMDHYIKGRPGSPDSNKHLAQAVELFDKVINLCDIALRNDPGNTQIESRQADAAKYGYHARKMKTLSVRG
jgi:hypothetical protein